MIALAGLARCGGSAAGTTPPAATATPRPSAAAASAARIGQPAASERLSFVPTEIVLPGDARAAVLPAETVGGALVVPVNVNHVGWWDGSASAGDPFGSVVVAGHVDSATEGIGFFARLLRVKIGDTVTLRDGEHRLAYRITSVQKVAKRALATDSLAFDQAGPHRLVLITCTGTYRRDRGGYDSNLVVTGRPIGLAR